MNDKKKYLNHLKNNLNQYEKNLSSLEDSFKDKESEAGDKFYTAFQNVLREAREAYRKLESAAEEEWEPFKKIASQSFEDLKDAFEDLKNSTSEEVKEYANQIEEYSQETFEAGMEYIKSNPFKSVLLAGGLGFVIGRLLK